MVNRLQILTRLPDSVMRIPHSSGIVSFNISAKTLASNIQNYSKIKPVLASLTRLLNLTPRQIPPTLHCVIFMHQGDTIPNKNYPENPVKLIPKRNQLRATVWFRVNIQPTSFSRLEKSPASQDFSFNPRYSP